MTVMALRQNRFLHPEADQISLDLVQKWIRSNWKGYVDVEAMFEKVKLNMTKGILSVYIISQYIY